MTRFERARSVRIAVASVLLFVLGACGGNAGAQEPTLIVGSPCKVCLRTMLTAAGEDKNTSYRIEWADFDSAPPLIEAMNAGRVDVAWMGEVPALFGISHGAKVKLLAASQGPPEAASRILVKQDSALRTVADLKGKRVAMPFYTVTQYPLVKAFEKAGLGWNDVQMVNLSTTDGLAAFNSGQVDAFAIWDANAATVETDHGGRTLQALGQVANPDQTYAAGTATLSDPAKKAALGDLTRRVVRAMAWVDSHEIEWAQQMVQRTGISPGAARLAAARDKWQLAPIDDHVVGGWQQEVDYFHGIGQIKLPFAVRDTVAPGFGALVADERAKLAKGPG
ncbi:PhnD/SsuA/transferrin family substrate-binding protein [Amycolatopsis benzoatilytica]|uniref:PhnD/SsuA/transferrin family substrate-binding protein n=1 Tax=Amycolatopsis benzoatilytica TaxID=346045 RepID=UPI00037875ED|nr:PhnD/SsuA/transferrin family substrate-binding protein [Amycolatopsis benzoatilytica]